MGNHIFTGSGVALVTPMNSDGSVNYDVLEQLLEFHVENGTDAIIACGTTGEAATLSEEEHCKVLSCQRKSTEEFLLLQAQAAMILQLPLCFLSLQRKPAQTHSFV